MGHIKEPIGIELVVDSTPLTIDERKKISEIIAYYKSTGKKKVFSKSKEVNGTKKPTKEKVLV